jgi:hypothetical protein
MTGDDAVLNGARDPDAVRNALKVEREAAKAAKEEARIATADADALRAEVRELKERERIAAEESHVAMLAEVAKTAGLPASFGPRLRGDTKTELEADAREIARTTALKGHA